MTSVDGVVDMTVAEFDEHLHGLRFRQVGTVSRTLDSWRWTGQFDTSQGAAEVEITLPPAFPFAPPRITLPGRSLEDSWHCEPDGNLCLWSELDKAGLPWLDVKALERKVVEWIEADASGWKDDELALDLNAYFPPDIDNAVVLVDDWPPMDDRWFATQRDAFGRERIAYFRDSYERAIRLAHRGNVGVVLDIGERKTPKLDWGELQILLGPEGVRDVFRALGTKKQVLLLLRYERAGTASLLTLCIRKVVGGVKLSSVVTANGTQVEKALRGGSSREILQSKRVAVVGIGAVGSFVADQLSRRGVGELLLLDSDLLSPGNVIRHLCDDSFVGLHKTSAVKIAIERRRLPGTSLVTTASKVQTLDEAVELMTKYDLVVDATADPATQHLFLTAGRIAGDSFISVAVEGHGQYARVDVVPPPAGTSKLPNDNVLPTTLLVGAGCGDPVSPTSPSAVIETASIGTRIAVDMLLGTNRSPGERRGLAAA